MQQGAFNRLDFGLQYVFEEQLSFGMTVATVPEKKSNNTSTINSISSFAGIRWQGFRFGYSYDINTLELLNTGGIHEFSVSYDFDINIRALDRYKCVPFF